MKFAAILALIAVIATAVILAFTNSTAQKDGASWSSKPDQASWSS